MLLTVFSVRVSAVKPYYNEPSCALISVSVRCARVRMYVVSDMFVNVYSDAYYFYSLERDIFGFRRQTLLNPGWGVVTAMAVFVFMGRLCYCRIIC